MNLLTIGGVVMPTPNTYEVPSSDLDSPETKLTGSGYLKRKRIRAGRLKIVLGWTNKTLDEMLAISAAVAPAELSVTFFDPWSGGMVTKTMYASADKNSKGKIIKDVSDSRWDISFNLTEY